MRPTWAEVDLGAVAHNVGLLVERAAPAAVCAVVKADGYGHGAVPVARAALEGGATWLAVALVEEAAVLRADGIDAPILLLSEARPDEMADVAALDLRATVYTATGVAAAAATGAPLRLHLKVDTGMHRVGAAPEDAVALAQSIVGEPDLELEAVWTHCAVADEPEHPFTAEQLARFDDVLAALRVSGIEVPLTHAANSAGAIAHPAARRSLVRTRYRRLRHRPVPGAGRCAPVASRPPPAFRGEPSSSGWRRGRGSPTACTTPSIGPPPWPPCPSATPTVSVAAWASSARRCSSVVGGARWSASSPWTS